ncbi:MAG: hypothetical protein ACE5E1_05470 [Phycisphaerae bacterium]
MDHPRAWRARAAARLSLGSLLIGTVPRVSMAEWGPGGGDLSEKLRHGPGIVNHPVNVVPSAAVRIPTGWPLASDGTLTCSTCHERLPSLDGQGNPFLRGSDEIDSEGGEFCTKCHGDPVPGRAGSMHWMAVRVAHVLPERDASARSGGGLDPVSRRCLTCHDGVNATDSLSRTTRGRGDFGDMRRNHPVGIPYPDQGAKPRNVPFRSSFLLPNRIRLPGGRVSCVSCHDLYAQGPNKLAVPIEGSRLCFACHQLDG